MMTIDNNMNVDGHEQTKGVCRFLAKYAATLLACGATTMRIEKNIERMAERFDMDIEIIVLPMHVMVTLWNKDHTHSYSINEKLHGIGIDYNKNTQLSKLSWNVYDNRISLEEAEKQYQAIDAQPRLKRWLVIVLTSLANASFCRLFGGDGISMLIVFVATFNGFYLKEKLQVDYKMDIRLVAIIAGCVATIQASAGYVFHWGSTPDIALGTGVLFLVPGVPFINSIHDMIHGHYICSMSRFLQASLITICLSLGLCLGLLIMNFKVL